MGGDWGQGVSHSVHCRHSSSASSSSLSPSSYLFLHPSSTLLPFYPQSISRLGHCIHCQTSVSAMYFFIRQGGREGGQPLSTSRTDLLYLASPQLSSPFILCRPFHHISLPPCPCPRPTSPFHPFFSFPPNHFFTTRHIFKSDQRPT